MKIETASVAMASQHSEVSHHRVQEQLRLWNGNHRLELNRDSSRTSASSMVTHLSARAQAMPRNLPAAAPATMAQAAPASQAASSADAESVDPKLEPLIRLVELITGRKVRLFRAEDLTGKAPSQSTPNPNPAAQRAGWGLSYDRTETRYEAQHTQVQVEGTVKTSDGREINFALSLEMRREYLETSSVSLRAGDALLKDPLVIHFDGPVGELSDLRFDFDLDADGNLDNMAFVGAGSGFLVLDKNGNGSVDDGRELFGALSGDGFADLAALDDDGNGWIDENDRAFDQLQVWQKDAEGQDRLRSLREANVGALYLGRVASPFSVRDASNQTLGEVRSTGVYLREDGGAGALQQIDLAV
ncbi:hypothetical protein [Hydrogenophaga atypica]|uniref:VCBS repeat-containing protein n=1 Tax=Hydrogenophaga atypica TaxID=249409 RepID=A0ABW2QNJ8_9BURK